MTYVPKVKICGIRDGDSAVEAAGAGADFLGVNLVEGVRRQLTPLPSTGGRPKLSHPCPRSPHQPTPRQRAKSRRTVPKPRRPMGKLGHPTDRPRLRSLCGDEDEAYIRSMWKPVLRPIHVKPNMSRDELSDLVDHHLELDRIVLLDTYDENTPGGTGKTFDWSIAEGIVNREACCSPEA